MKRREFPAKVKMAAFERADGRCEGCSAKLVPGKYQYDHAIPDATGGEPTLSNCVVLCSNCHGSKTATMDAPRIAKTRRQSQKHVGARPKPRQTIPGSRASGWKHKINGQWERRT